MACGKGNENYFIQGKEKSRFTVLRVDNNAGIDKYLYKNKLCFAHSQV